MLEQVSRRVWVATSPTWSTTSSVVVADDGACLLVDPALLPGEVVALAREFEGRGWRVTAAFSTHPHWDHVLWSAALPAVPRWATASAARWAADNTDVLAGQAEADLPGHNWEVIGGTTALPAAGDGAVSGPAAVEVPWRGPRAVAVAAPGHALGHAALYLPDDGVLLAGDMLSDLEIPLLDTGHSDPVAQYRRGLAALAGLIETSDVVVPGHGTPAGREEARDRLAADVRYLDRLLEPDDPRLGQRRMRAEHDLQVQELGARVRAGGSPTGEPGD